MTFAENVVFDAIHCGNCDIIFAISREMITELKRTGKLFYCPNGHHIGYSDNETKRLRTQLDTKSRELVAARCETLAERQKREQAEAALARHQKRTKNGVCPCCHRSFEALARHIKTKHPYYKP